LSSTERNRKTKVRERRQLDSVNTESPVTNPNELAQKRALENIHRSASVSRRVMVPLLLLAIVAIASLPFLSRAPATMVSLVIAIGTVILGVAARPFIENAISGLVMSFSRLINIGDTVKVEGLYGTIEDISSTHTIIKLWDWRRFVVPNSRMLQQSFYNYSVHDKYEWTYVSFTVSYEAQIDKVRELVIPLPKESKSFANHEEPQFWVMEMGPQGYEVWLAAWANTPSDAWTLRADLRTAIVRTFQEHQIPLHCMRHEIVSSDAAAA
jgi:small-conductance mechanosensitive channel